MRKTILAFLALTAGLIEAAPFSINGWQFHDYNIPKLEQAIQKAPAYGVNLFIFSHGLFDHTEQVMDSPQHVRDIQYVGSLADKQKIPWYLWVHEFDDIPNRFRVKQEIAPNDPRLSQAGKWFSFRIGNPVNMDDPAVLEYLRQRYERLFALFPTSAGVVLTFHESDAKIFRNSEVISKLTVPQRIYTLTKLIYDVAKKHHKQLILRNFFYEPKEMEYYAEALPKLPDDIILMSKDTVHEFQPFYPPDPMHGKAGAKRQIFEADLGTEKALANQGHYAQTDYIRRYVKRASDLGMAGAVGRARLDRAHPFEDSHEVNLYAFSRFMQDPNLDADTVLLDWARRRYPEQAAPFIASALKRTEFINHHGRYFLGFWLTRGVGGDWEDYVAYFNHLLLRSQYKWTKDPADKQLEQSLYYPDQATFDKLVAEKDEVIRQVHASMADMRNASRYLTPEQAGPLEEGFRFLLDATELEKEWTRAYFAQRMWMQQPSEESALIVRDALAKLEAMDRAPGVDYGRDSGTGHRYHIDKFVLEMRWRMANRERALEEDNHILEVTAEMMAVEAQ